MCSAGAWRQSQEKLVRPCLCFRPAGWDNEKKIAILHENFTTVKPEDAYEDFIVKPPVRKVLKPLLAYALQGLNILNGQRSSFYLFCYFMGGKKRSHARAFLLVFNEVWCADGLGWWARNECILSMPLKLVAAHEVYTQL